MMDIKQIEIEYKISVIFAAGAFFISILLGFITGNNIGLILLRSFIFLLVFFCLGYAAVFVIKKYVPEVYNLISIKDAAVSAEDSQIEINDASGILNNEEADKSVTGEGIAVNKDSSADIEDNRALEDDALEDEISSVDREQDVKSHESHRPTVKKSKLESDIEQKIKYEPKIVAEAVRTMMRRDEE